MSVPSFTTLKSVIREAHGPKRFMCCISKNKKNTDVVHCSHLYHYLLKCLWWLVCQDHIGFAAHLRKYRQQSQSLPRMFLVVSKVGYFIPREIFYSTYLQPLLSLVATHSALEKPKLQNRNFSWKRNKTLRLQVSCFILPPHPFLD